MRFLHFALIIASDGFPYFQAASTLTLTCNCLLWEQPLPMISTRVRVMDGPPHLLDPRNNKHIFEMFHVQERVLLWPVGLRPSVSLLLSFFL